MSYTNPLSINPGDPVDSDDLNTAIQDIQKYTQTGIVQADIEDDTAWIERRHIVRGEPILEIGGFDHNSTIYVSGTAQGHFYSSDKGDLTYLSRYTSRREEGSGVSAVWTYIPNTCVRIVIPRKAEMVMVQFSVWPLASANQDGNNDGDSVFKMVFANTEFDLLDINNNTYTKDATQGNTVEEEDTGLPAASIGDEDRCFRKPYQTYWIETNADPGVYYAALVGNTQLSKTRFLEWSCVVESWIE